MLTADAYLDVLFHFPCHVNCHLHQPAHPFCVNALKWVHVNDPLFQIEGQELALGVLPAEAKSSLCQVIRAKADKVCQVRDVVSHKAGAHHFDHAAKLDL